MGAGCRRSKSSRLDHKTGTPALMTQSSVGVPFRSESSSAWQSAAFGTRRPGDRSPPLRPPCHPLPGRSIGRSPDSDSGGCRFEACSGNQRPCPLTGQETGFSTRQWGFESPQGYHARVVYRLGPRVFNSEKRDRHPSRAPLRSGATGSTQAFGSSRSRFESGLRNQMTSHRSERGTAPLARPYPKRATSSGRALRGEHGGLRRSRCRRRCAAARRRRSPPRRSRVLHLQSLRRCRAWPSGTCCCWESH